MSTTKRFYFDIQGRDDQALKEGFAWLIGEASDGRGIVTVPGLQQVEKLVPGLSTVEAQRLKQEKRLQRSGTTIELVTRRTGALRPMAGAPVLAVWVDDEQLEKLERERPSAICAIPWHRSDLDRWRDAYSPTEMRSGTPAAGKSTITNPVVECALKSLTSRVNLSTGLTHPSDRAAAVGLFRILKGGGERYNPVEVSAWAANTAGNSQARVNSQTSRRAFSTAGATGSRPTGGATISSTIGVLRQRQASKPSGRPSARVHVTRCHVVCVRGLLWVGGEGCCPPPGDAERISRRPAEPDTAPVSGRCARQA
jgi:hypothetical protein